MVANNLKKKDKMKKAKGVPLAFWLIMIRLRADQLMREWLFNNTRNNLIGIQSFQADRQL